MPGNKNVQINKNKLIKTMRMSIFLIYYLFQYLKGVVGIIFSKNIFWGGESSRKVSLRPYFVYKLQNLDSILKLHRFSDLSVFFSENCDERPENFE